MPACTQNGGDIGPLFGSWHLESMTCDGEPFAQPAGTDTFWNFQGHVVIAILSKGMYETLDFTGTWEQRDGLLVLDYTHSSDNAAPGTQHYRAPYWMGFPENEVIDLTIIKLDNSTMMLSWTSAQGRKYNYNFKKTW